MCSGRGKISYCFLIGKDYIHVQKGLLVLEYLLLHGSEQVLTESRVHQPEISTLTDFRSTHAADNGALSLFDLYF